MKELILKWWIIPDEIVDLQVDKEALPKDSYTEVGFKARQVININITKIVTEYRAQILQNAAGIKYTAAFRSIL